MNKTDSILERLKNQPMPTIDNPDELTDSIMDRLPESDTTKGVHIRRLSKWIAAAVVAGLVCMIGLKMERLAEEPQTAPIANAIRQTPVQKAVVEKEEHKQEVLPEQPTAPRIKMRQVKSAVAQASVCSMAPIEAVEDIVAHIEKRMQDVKDSCYIANVEKMIRTDDRLQQLMSQLAQEGIITETCIATAYNDSQYNN